MTTLIEDEIHESYLQVIDQLDRAVVTVIEILSPANKMRSSRGRRTYQQKRVELMNSPSHLIEIDLLRDGKEFAPENSMPAHEYSVHVSRAQFRPKGKLWPIRLDQRLPTIPIPLKSEDPDGELDFQAVLTTAYDRAAYDLQVDYTADPHPPLNPEQSAWADQLLREKGLRAADSR